jgi:hypothetical protein
VVVTLPTRLAFVEGDPERAALMAGAAEGLRRRAGLRPWPVVWPGGPDPVSQMRQAIGADRFDEVFAAGSRLNQRDAAPAAHDRNGASISIALGVVLFIHPDIGAASLATVFGLFSVIYGVSAVVLSIQARHAASTARQLLTPAS